jgi:hypothetical protein
MDRGNGSWKWLLILLVLGSIVYGFILFAPPFLNQACLKSRMETQMRNFSTLGEEEMILTIIKLAKQDCNINNLRYESFQFKGDIGLDSVLRCKYSKVVQLPGDRIYILKFTPEVRIRIPDRQIGG